MKYSLYCFLFGHKWAAYTARTENGVLYTDGAYRRRIMLANCYRCGLSKPEAGITSKVK